MSIIKKLRECAPYHAHNILFKRPSLGSAGFRFVSGWALSSAVFMEENMRNIFQKMMECVPTARMGNDLSGLSAGLKTWKSNAVAWKSNAVAWKNSAAAWKSNAVAWKSSAAASRFMMLAAISLSLTLAGCDTGGGGGDSSGNGGGGTPTCADTQILKDGQCEACPAQQKPNADKTACISADTPTCTGNQALQNNQCVACTDPQYPNSDRTACVTSCDDGELKPDNKPTCETMVTCTGDMIHNPADNTCIENTCLANELVNTTVTPNGCITKSKCRGDNGKVVSTNEQSCIRESACSSVAGQVATTAGNCEVCEGETSVVNVEQNACISEDACHGGNSSGENSILDNRCITDAACQDMAGHVATDDGDCEQCTGANNVRNVGKTECITATACHAGNSSGPNSLLGTDCITDEACLDMDNHVAQHDGVCMECVGGKVPNTITGMCDTDADSDGVGDASDNCLDLANASQTDTDKDGIGNDCDHDDDNDGVADANDDFPTDACASMDTDDDNMPDRLVAGCTTSLTADTDDDGDGTADTMDVDDDNDGLIEIATAAELDNIRHDLAGASYNDGSTASTTGAPTEQTANCETATNSVYLCGYELAADIDLDADDQDTGDADSNFEPITGAFTAILDGNGRAINNMQITKTNADDANAAFIDNCNGSVIRNLYIQDADIASTSDASGTINVSFLCAGAGHSTWHKTRIIAVRAQGSLSCATTNNCYLGGLVARSNATAFGGFLITGSMVELAASSQSQNYAVAGGIIGFINTNNSTAQSRISNSYALGHSADTGNTLSSIGGLAGYMSATQGAEQSIKNSYTAVAIGTISSAFTTSPGVGGLIGYFLRANGNSTSCVARNNYTLGPIAVSTSANNLTGGLIGFAISTLASNSYARGPVYSNTTAGALIGTMEARNGFTVELQNSYSSGAVFGSGTRGGLIGLADGSKITYTGRNLYVDSAGSANGGIGSVVNRATACPAANCANVTEAAILALPLDLDATTDTSPAEDTELNGWSTTNWAKNANEHPRLKYADDPDTDFDECELLPDYDHAREENCVPGGTFCCGQELPHQRLYGSIANVTFTHDHDGDGGSGSPTAEEPVAIGEPTATAPRTGFYYTLSQPAVTVTYNLLTGISVASVALENDDGTPNTDATWTASGATGGSISGIASGESFWLAITFQKGTGDSVVQHKVRRKFVYP